MISHIIISLWIKVIYHIIVDIQLYIAHAYYIYITAFNSSYICIIFQKGNFLNVAPLIFREDSVFNNNYH